MTHPGIPLILLKFRNQQEKNDSLKEVLASLSPPRKEEEKEACAGVEMRSSRHIHFESPWGEPPF